MKRYIETTVLYAEAAVAYRTIDKEVHKPQQHRQNRRMKQQKKRMTTTTRKHQRCLSNDLTSLEWGDRKTERSLHDRMSASALIDGLDTLNGVQVFVNPESTIVVAITRKKRIRIRFRSQSTTKPEMI